MGRGRTRCGHRNLRDGLKEFGVLGSGAFLDSGVNKLREMASMSQVASNA